MNRNNLDMLQITVHTGLRRDDCYTFPPQYFASHHIEKIQTLVTPRIRTVSRGTQDIPLAGIGGTINPGLLDCQHYLVGYPGTLMSPSDTPRRECDDGVLSEREQQGIGPTQDSYGAITMVATIALYLL
jgi:hypothetical protein